MLSPPAPRQHYEVQEPDDADVGQQLLPQRHLQALFFDTVGAVYISVHVQLKTEAHAVRILAYAVVAAVTTYE